MLMCSYSARSFPSAKYDIPDLTPMSLCLAFFRVLNNLQIAADKPLLHSFLLPSAVLVSVVKASFRGSTVAVIFLLYEKKNKKEWAVWSNKRCKGPCTCLVHCLASHIAVSSSRPSSLFRILGSVLGKWGSRPWLSASPSSHIVSSWSREVGGGWHSDGESTLGRRFSNYTLETNQPEHCFLISRTKQ